MKFTRLMTFILVLTWLLVGCGQAAQSAPSNNESSAPTSSAGSGSGDSAASTTGKKLNVVTTVSPITNIIYNIGGDRINLSGIVPEGVNSHTFEPAPSDAKNLAEADLIFINGLKLEEPTLELAEANKKVGAEIILLGEQTIIPAKYVYDFSFPKEAGSPNPHLWPNPFHSLRYAEIGRDALVRRDPANADYYKKNYDAFKIRIETLDRAIRETINSIPEQNRKLLTYHDSWAYFAPRYGMTVIGAIQPSDFAEPSAQEVATLIKQVKAEQVPAIFGSEVFPSPVLEQIAKEAGASYVDDLRDDDLPGQPGDPNHSYLGLMVENLKIMASNLGGKPELIANFDTSNVPGVDSAVEQAQ
ncbi:MAG: zinc ABC transporter substrate-binding protein [Anaerolineae bacterium]|nr:zinc ABC transporter substrate-binding protein [Anaerolineae bacterium]